MQYHVVGCSSQGCSHIVYKSQLNAFLTSQLLQQSKKDKVEFYESYKWQIHTQHAKSNSSELKNQVLVKQDLSGATWSTHLPSCSRQKSGGLSDSLSL